MVPVKERVLQELKGGVPLDGLRLSHLVSHVGIVTFAPGQDGQIWESFDLRKGAATRVVYDGSIEDRIALGLGIIAQGQVHRSGFDPDEVGMVMGRDDLFDEASATGILTHLHHYQWKPVAKGNFRGAISTEARSLLGFLGVGAVGTEVKTTKERVEVRIPNMWLDSPTMGAMVLVLREPRGEQISTVWVPQDEWSRG